MDKNSGGQAPPPLGRARGRSRGRARSVVVLPGAQAAPTVPQFPAAMAPPAALPRTPGVLRPATVSLPAPSVAPSMPALDSMEGLSFSIDRVAIGHGAHHQQMAAKAPSDVFPHRHHKVLRRDSVFDLMSQIQHVPNYKNECVKRVAGCIVMTPYNNKTYKVDGIDWDMNPACTFQTKKGPKTYADYYRVHVATSGML
ncbi:hypothetical protein V5799_002693 [Amblyomma americanum]|uniref:PAZ domain-containing protein n=1 Tax=Amblyomma americanum TaxID=6943 RepID=A0AAQ4DB36_AMBAM